MQAVPSQMESLEGRLCLSATHHHFYTGVRPHVAVAAVSHRHHFHTGVRARVSIAINPPAVLGQLPTIQGSTSPGSTLTPPPLTNGGLFGSGGSIFGGGGSIFG